MGNEKLIKDISSGARYLLMLMSRPLGLVENKIKDKNIRDFVNISSLSERSVIKYLSELKESGILSSERHVIFKKGRGENSYTLHEKFNLSMKHTEIVDMVLFLNDLKPMQKFIFITLLSSSDDFGVVDGLGLVGLTKLTGMGPQTIKDHLMKMIELGFVFGYSPGGNIEIFPSKVKGMFYLNLVKYESSQLKIVLLEKSLPYNDIIKYHSQNNEVNSKVGRYIKNLSPKSKAIFFNSLTCKVDKFSGGMLTKIVKLKTEINLVQSFIDSLQQNVFKIDGGRVKTVNYAQFRKHLSNFNFFNYIKEDIRKEFLHEWLDNPSLEKEPAHKMFPIAKELSEEVIYLVHLYAFWMYFDVLLPDGMKFAVIRKCKNGSPNEELKSPPCILVGKPISQI
ncbi:hypothetical protein [Colwellia psychrerythraea]|nr:hypothetical protein [Colwellia psychrerythraea]